MVMMVEVVMGEVGDIKNPLFERISNFKSLAKLASPSPNECN